MAHDSQQLPIDGENLCMVCKVKPTEEEKLSCKTCGTPWHVQCLVCPPDSMASALQWECPDCSISDVPLPPLPPQRLSSGQEDGLIAAVRAIEADSNLTEREKAVKRQQLLSGKAAVPENGKDNDDNDVLRVLDGSLNCSFCMQLPDRPVTTPCGHNFCLKCFEKWVGQGKRTCAKCRQAIPAKMASQPRINSTLVSAIRMAKISRSIASGGSVKVYHFVQNQDRPEKAYTTDRAKRNGKANAASGKIFVTVPPDHFGPIPAENDPERNQGIVVGECWEDRLECRQWGAHLPHVAGIAGQSDYGAQSVALSGGYIDDEDHGEWFLYTGSGGRDLSGNKRTSKEQSFDQKFDKMNQALRVSCLKGYPVRVVRSHKEKRSSYAPEKGVRYDGVYRIEKCWRKVGIQGFKVCRYLFVRCDNEPAPWTSDDHGDRPRPLPVIPELKKATDITERKGSPSWDFDQADGQWKWLKPPPASRKPVHTGNPEDRAVRIRRAQKLSVREKLLKGFSCLICRQVMTSPVTTPCGHNFCKSCLEGEFAGKALVRERNRGGRTLRSQKNVLNCPHCPVDISDFLQDPKVNRELMDVIESLKSKVDDDDAAEEIEEETEAPGHNTGEGCSLENDDEENNVSLEKADGEENKVSLEKTDVDFCKQDAGDGGNNDLEAPVMKRSSKRKKSDSGAYSSKQSGVKTRKRKKAHQTGDEGNESPSSPLHVKSDDDFE